MNSGTGSPKSLADALDDHSAEGIAILASEPSKYMRAMILLLVGLLLVALGWSFIGRADVIVTATGVLSPESDVRRFYAPVEGELVDIYVTEGTPVSAGDVLARINARGVIEVAAAALDADLKLTDAQRDFDRFPARRTLMERQAEALQSRIDVEQKLHERRVLEGVTKLAERHKAKLAEARGSVEIAREERRRTGAEAAKLRRLAGTAGGGGISKRQIAEAASAAAQARTAYSVADAQLGELDYKLSAEYAEATAALDASEHKLTEMRLDYELAVDEIDKESNRVKMRLESTKLAAEAARRITFDNIDEDNFLTVLAPISGVVTELSATQQGDKIQPHTPLGGIAPEEARPIVKTEIAERDRAFLREGLSVKLKFSAFPYARYGFIEGTLVYISPTTVRSEADGGPVYKGHVRLATQEFTIDGAQFPLRYGMLATAEMVVRKRRLIDLALDPFREIAG